MSETLRPLQLPLYGSRLIEASAGTGKTFTLALLYLRLVLGHGDDSSRFTRPLVPREILVVTFTDAAAKELRERIRARLVEAAALFRQPDRTLQPDDPLQALRQAYPRQDWPARAWQLEAAAQAMDEACISTIHAWCNRVLSEHVFATRGLFGRELLSDTLELLSEAVRDYWRVHFYPLASAEARQVAAAFATPADLQAALAGLLQQGVSGLTCQGKPLRVRDILHWIRAWQAHTASLQVADAKARACWRQDWTALAAYLLELRPHLHGTYHASSKKESFVELLGQIRAWADGGEEPSKLKNFAQDAFVFKKTAKVQAARELPAFVALRDLLTLRQQPPELPLAAAILGHALDWVRPRFAAGLAQQAALGFDDLLSQLEQALDPARGGALARELAERLRADFPIAMIDEFQDTDPTQYRIFDHIYRIEANDAASGLLLIGDPKQSIYGFRGADIHSYLRARAATAGRHYSLACNYRSSAALVQACNDLFGWAERHPGGAFRFRQDGADPVPYVQVNAADRTEPLWLGERLTEPLSIWYFGPGADQISLASDDYQAEAAEVAASQVCAWLLAGRDGRAGFGHNGVERPLQAKDIAILVRNGKEAKAVRQALAWRGVASVYLSDRDSVFASAEALDLYHWLRACAEPGNDRLVRIALATNSLDLPLASLVAWQEDELAWEVQMQHFARFQQIWRRQGVLVLIYRLLEVYQLPARLLQRDQGERSLTNLLHLAEWLQRAAEQLDGEQALIRHLLQQLQAEDRENLLRLESDAERVRVITIHKSKGLEYPLVVLPFIAGWRAVDGKTPQVPWRHEKENYVEVAGKSAFETAWQQADADRLSEDMRLLYVACTRASHGLWLGIGPLRSGNAKAPQLHHSAIGYLLNGGQAFADDQAVYQALQNMQQACTGVCLLPAPRAENKRLTPLAQAALEPARPPPRLGNLTDWWIASYSALGLEPDDPGALRSHADQEPESAVEATALESRDEAGQDLARPALAQVMHQLPAGSLWGTFLHSLLEWAAGHVYRTADGRLLEGFAASRADAGGRTAQLYGRCRLRGIQDHAEALSEWLEGFLSQPWPLPQAAAVEPLAEPVVAPLVLERLTPAEMAVELEFLLESQRLDAQLLDAWVCRHVLPGQARPRLQPVRLNGLFKGFIDLVVQHQGRYYVIDWKSNRLGDGDAAYTEAAMREAVLHKRYDLQYVLYLLALHRLLRACLPDYDYDRHVGGALYLFLRGTQGPAQGCYRDRPPKVLIEALDALFRGQDPNPPPLAGLTA